MTARRVAVAAVVLVACLGAAGCSDVAGAAPSCGAVQRVAVVAQSVPSASYVPCIGDLRPGWRTQRFVPGSSGTRFALVSDRDPGHPVEVRLQGRCDEQGATPTTARATGVRTSLRLAAVSPRFRGTMLDVFPGGCISYDFDFARGPHISLVDDFEHAVQLVSRRQLRLDLRERTGVELGS